MNVVILGLVVAAGLGLGWWPEMVGNFFTTSRFTALVNAISILSFGVTIFVYRDVSRIKKFYIFVGRVPALTKDLRQHAAEISDYLNDFEGSLSQIQEELARAEATLESLVTKLDGPLKKSILQLLKTTKSYDSKSKGNDGLRAIYLDMVKVHAKITNLQEDHKWEIQS